MKPWPLALLIVAFGVIGSLLVAATPEDGQAPVAAIVAIALALTLGGLWPVRREFVIAGVTMGFLFAVGIASYMIFWALTSDSMAFRYGHVERSRYIVNFIPVTFAIFGGWTFVMMIGANIGWLVQLVARRPRRALA